MDKLKATHSFGNTSLWQDALAGPQSNMRAKRSQKIKTIRKNCSHAAPSLSFWLVFQETAGHVQTHERWQLVPYTGCSLLFFSTSRNQAHWGRFFNIDQEYMLRQLQISGRLC